MCPLFLYYCVMKLRIPLESEANRIRSYEKQGPGEYLGHIFLEWLKKEKIFSGPYYILGIRCEYNIKLGIMEIEKRM